MTGIGSLVVQGVRLHVFRNVFIKRSTSGSLWVWFEIVVWLSEDSVLEGFGADCLCFQLQDGWLADLFVY